jgi:Tfp pilus assembly protein PilZ
MTNLSRGGVFIATQQPAEIGTRLELQLHIEETGERSTRPQRWSPATSAPASHPASGAWACASWR